ncbi:MAG: hypothetical protein L7F78_01315 [Syntrophales bacterium LBB04]|nr:hypothetical protein [Syntrophales bacterium LBB04]
MKSKGFGLLGSLLFFVLLSGVGPAHAYLVYEGYTNSAGVDLPKGTSVHFHFDLMDAGPANPSGPWSFSDGVGASGLYTDGLLDIKFLNAGFGRRMRMAKISLEVGSETAWQGAFRFETGEVICRLDLGTVPDLLPLLNKTGEMTLTIYNSSRWDKDFAVGGAEMTVEGSYVPIPPTILLLVPCLAGLVVARTRRV